jgi:hypothetical protein
MYSLIGFFESSASRKRSCAVNKVDETSLTWIPGRLELSSSSSKRSTNRGSPDRGTPLVLSKASSIYHSFAPPWPGKT